MKKDSIEVRGGRAPAVLEGYVQERCAMSQSKKTTLPTGPKRRLMRNPNDATFRNITALKARVTRLELVVKRLVGHVRFILDHRP